MRKITAGLFMALDGVVQDPQNWHFPYFNDEMGVAVSAQLGNAGMTASKLETTATITLDKLPDGFAITKSHLDLVARVPGADKAKFDAAVKAAETGCPVSKLFKAEISVTARLES